MPRRVHTTPAPRIEEAPEVVVSNDVVVERWEQGPLLERVAAQLADKSGPALAIGSINIDHFHHFGKGRIELPNEPRETGVEWLMLADGAPVAARAAVAAGRSWPRLTGADLLPELLDLAAAQGSRVGFLGGMPEVHARLDEILKESYPDMVARYWAPEREEIDSQEGSERIAAQIKAEGIDLLAVSLGKPRQELWIQTYGDQTGACVQLAFGASADFMAGKVDRAPQWMREHGLEWAYRLGQEPGRLSRRYLVEGPVAMARLLPARKVKRRGKVSTH